MLVGFLLIIVTVEADTIAELFSKLKSESSKDYYAARGQIISQRKKIIDSVTNTFKDKEARKNSISTIVNLVELLGELQAIEAVNELFQFVGYHRETGDEARSIIYIDKIPLKTTDPSKVRKDYPAVGALIDIRVQPVTIIKALLNANRVPLTRNCLAVLRGVAGDDVARYILKDAIDKETDPNKKVKLETAFKLIR